MTIRGAHDRLAGAGPLPADRSAQCRLRRGHGHLHVYADPVATGGPAEQRYPGIAAHLRACGPCGEDFDALLAAVRDDAS
jgi:hypothetical protein